MSDLGVTLSNGLNSWMRGMEFGERMRAQKDEQAWAEEMKARQRADWQASDEQRAKGELANQLSAYYEALKSGVDIDPKPLRAALQGASQHGVHFGKYLMEPDKTRQWVDAAEAFIQTGQGGDGALEAFNWRFREEIEKGIGDEIDRDMVMDGLQIPKGSKIIGKRAKRAVPNLTKDGFFLGLETTVRTPDGRTLTYEAPVTRNRSTADDDAVLSIPLERLFATLKGDQMMLEGLDADPKFADAIRVALTAMGKAPPRDEKTSAIREFEYAKREVDPRSRTVG